MFKNAAIFGILVMTVTALIAVNNWQWLALGSAALHREARPDFLADATWRQSDSSKLIKSRFLVGSAESDLIAALKAEKFSVDAQHQTAERLLRNIPCNELLQVSWASDGRGKIVSVVGRADEAGCL